MEEAACYHLACYFISRSGRQAGILEFCLFKFDLEWLRVSDLFILLLVVSILLGDFLKDCLWLVLNTLFFHGDHAISLYNGRFCNIWGTILDDDSFFVKNLWFESLDSKSSCLVWMGDTFSILVLYLWVVIVASSRFINLTLVSNSFNIAVIFGVDRHCFSLNFYLFNQLMLLSIFWSWEVFFTLIFWALIFV